MLIICFCIALFVPMEHLAGKGMTIRAPLFILGSFIIYIVSLFKKWEKYPHASDFFLTIPFLLDTLGNLFGLFDSITIFDDVIHLVNWIFIVMAYQSFRFQKVKDNRDSIMLGFGFGTILIVFWEIAEWMISVDGFGVLNSLHLSYADTIGDLALSSIGGLIGAYLGVTFFGNAPRSL